jgi:hypothetical protein
VLERAGCLAGRLGRDGKWWVVGDWVWAARDGGDVPSLARSAYVMQLVASPREMDFDSRPATTACHLNLFCTVCTMPIPAENLLAGIDVRHGPGWTGLACSE